MSRTGKTFFAEAPAPTVAAKLKGWTVAASAFAASVFLSAGEASGQCALCRTALEGAGEATARTMNLGIVVLLIPPVAIFCAIFAVAYRKGRDAGEDSETSRTALDP